MLVLLFTLASCFALCELFCVLSVLRAFHFVRHGEDTDELHLPFKIVLHPWLSWQIGVEVSSYGTML